MSVQYRNYTIVYDPPPVGTRAWDFQFAHDDYDLDDPRIGMGESVEDCKQKIDEQIDEGVGE